MTCFHPLLACRMLGERKLRVGTSKEYPRLGRLESQVTERLLLPCGQCIGCRLERSRQWAIRCVHEAQLYKKNCFITLTYAPQNLPNPPSLNVRDYQLFMKRLRKKYGTKIRFFHCGEYGEQLGRPHYHACLFNHDFSDKKLWKIVNGHRLYISSQLEELWPDGFSTIGDVTFESAAYVARYIMKKINGDNAAEHYCRHDADGLIYNLKPEYTTMSRRPGLASAWFDKYSSDVYPSDEVILKGRRMRPPKFYDNILKKLSPLDYEEILLSRQEEAQKHLDDQTERRLADREAVQLARLAKLPRTLD